MGNIGHPSEGNMSLGSISPGSFISQPVLYIRDYLQGTLADPGSPRPGNSQFIMTSWPTRAAVYPVVIVEDNGIRDLERLGMQSESFYRQLPFTINVFGKDIVQRDSITQQVCDALRTNQFGTAGSESTTFGLHDFKLLSILPIPDVDQQGKDTGIRRKEIRISYTAVIE